MGQTVNVQAVISNISFPKTLNQLRWQIYDHGTFNVEDVLLDAPTTEWSVPNWITVGDIVFFFHAKTAIQKITHLETLLREDPSIKDRDTLQKALSHARKLYRQFGGKIYAVGRVSSRPFYEEDTEGEKYKPHWKSKIYAEIKDVSILENPIDISEFSDFIRVARQSTFTPVLRNDFTRLKEIIAEKNEIPDFLRNSVATPMPLREINEENWLTLTQTYRRAFTLEVQFRKFYVDFFLRALGDRRSFYTECLCYQNKKKTGYADYGIKLNKKICFVEVKLNFSAEKDLKGQLKKYCHVDQAELAIDRWVGINDIIQDYVLVIDREQFGIYDAAKDEIQLLEDLDKIKTVNDITQLRQQVLDAIFSNS